MGIVCHFGKPDLFITFTCNSQWKEITDELLEHQTPADHPDLVARVFKLKLYSFMTYIMAQQMFWAECLPLSMLLSGKSEGHLILTF